MTSAAPQPIEIFRAGRHIDVGGTPHVFTREDLVELAESYPAETDAAPFVIGHPDLDDQAMGWVERLDVDGDVLRAYPRDVVPDFAEAVRKGRFRKISSSFYPRDHAASPTPGKLALRHVGFFGAHAVSVKGLKPVHFSEAQQEGVTTFETPLKEAKLADQDKTAEFAERQTALDEREAKLKQGEDALEAQRAADAKARTDAAHAGHVSFAESQIAAGKLAPAMKSQVVHILDQLAAPAAMNFGEGEAAKSPVDLFKSLFESATPVVDFGEHPGMRVKLPRGGAISFAAPQGLTVDAERGVIHEAAIALQADNPKLSYLEAVKQASSGDA